MPFTLSYHDFMGAQAKVAVITRTRDRPLLLSRAIRSVVRQSFADWEMIIVNDGGERGAVRRAVDEHRTESRDRIRIVHNEVPRGRGFSCNAGIRNTQSDYIVVHDDDDTWEPDFLARCVSALESATNDERIKGVVSQEMQIEEYITGNEVIATMKKRYDPALEGLVPYSQMLMHNLYQPIAFLYSRSVHESIGYYHDTLRAA